MFGRVTKLWNKPDTDRSLLIKELVFGFESLALLAAVITCAAIIPRSAVVASPQVPQSTIALLLRGAGKSLKCAWLPSHQLH